MTGGPWHVNLDGEQFHLPRWATLEEGRGEHLPSLREKVMSSGLGVVGVKSYVTPGCSGSCRQLRIWF